MSEEDAVAELAEEVEEMAPPKRRSRALYAKRDQGRPRHGKLNFKQAHIDKLPDSGIAADVIRALGVHHPSFQQWCKLKNNPLPSVEKNGERIFKKSEVIKWLIRTKRFTPSQK